MMKVLLLVRWQVQQMIEKVHKNINVRKCSDQKLNVGLCYIFWGKNQMNREYTIKNVSLNKYYTWHIGAIPNFPTQIQPQTQTFSPPLFYCACIESHFQHFHC